jgi:hypothetical protein
MAMIEADAAGAADVGAVGAGEATVETRAVYLV